MEEKLKKFFQHSVVDDANLVVLDHNGGILERSHGSPDQEDYSRLRSKIESILRLKLDRARVD